MKMMYKLIAASMLTLALGTSAIAQSSTTGTSGTSGTSGATTATPGATDTMMMTEADKTLTKDWSGPIGDAFFTDDSMTTLKPQAEIQSSWTSLSTEQQAQVKQDCATVSSGTASAPGTSTDTTASTTPDTSGPAAGGTSSDTTASTTPDTTTGTGTTTSSDMAASGTAGSGTYSTAMTQLCSWVESM